MASTLEAFNFEKRQLFTKIAKDNPHLYNNGQDLGPKDKVETIRKTSEQNLLLNIFVPQSFSRDQTHEGKFASRRIMLFPEVETISQNSQTVV